MSGESALRTADDATADPTQDALAAARERGRLRAERALARLSWNVDSDFRPPPYERLRPQRKYGHVAPLGESSAEDGAAIEAPVRYH